MSDPEQFEPTKALEGIDAFMANFADEDDEIMIVLEALFRKICGG